MNNDYELFQQRLKQEQQDATASSIQRQNKNHNVKPPKQASYKKRSVPKSSSPASAGSNDSADDPMDDFDIMLFHEDFPHLLGLSSRVKGTRRKIVNVLHLTATTTTPTGTTTTGTISDELLSSLPSTSTVHRSKSALQPNEVLIAVERMQQALTAKKSTADRTSPTKVILRGRYPITDSLMEDAMLLLHEEFKSGEQWLIDHGKNQQVQESSAMIVVPPTTNNKRGRSILSTTDNSTATAPPITVKYAKWQTDILMNWMIDNKNAPFPDTEAISMLMHQTGLTNSQIVNWTTNVRKRNRKATCENGKKPHHFLDFLFLVHDRETKEAAAAAADALDDHLEEPTKFGRFTSVPSPPVTVASLPYGNSHVRANGIQHQEMNYMLPARLSKPSPVMSSEPHLYQDRYYHHQQPRLARSSRQQHYDQAELLSCDLTANVGTTLSGMDDAEPIPYLTKSDDAILIDFADCWLNEGNQHSDWMAMDVDNTDLSMSGRTKRWE
jgi:Homeobox KN domain